MKEKNNLRHNEAVIYSWSRKQNHSRMSGLHFVFENVHYPMKSEQIWKHFYKNWKQPGLPVWIQLFVVTILTCVRRWAGQRWIRSPEMTVWQLQQQLATRGQVLSSYTCNNIPPARFILWWRGAMICWQTREPKRILHFICGLSSLIH